MKNREKQIKEMAKVIRESEINFVKQRVRSIENDLIEPPPSRSEYIAIALMESGYRKASEVAREIIADFENIIEVDKYGEAKFDIRELYAIEKKYTEDTNVTTNTEEGNEQR